MENGSKKIGLRATAGVLAAITIIVAVFASGITFPTNEVNTGTLTVFLKDAPVDVNELWITVDKVEVHQVGTEDNNEETEENNHGGWLTIDFSTVTDELEFNLLDYQNENTLELGEISLDMGTYNKIRMNVTKAEKWIYEEFDQDGNPVAIDDDGRPLDSQYINTFPLKVPSNKIDVITRFDISSGENVIVVIDMEPDWVAISNSDNLRPTLKAIVFEDLSKQPSAAGEP